MKKTILTSVLLSSILLAGATSSQAATDTKEGKSDVNITLKKDTGSSTVENGDYKGKLSIVHTPTAFDFSGTASNNQITLENKSAAAATGQFLTVHDDRPEDKGAGEWTVDAKLSTVTRIDAATGNVVTTDDGTNAELTLPSFIQFNLKPITKYDIGTEETTVDGKKNIKPAAPNANADAIDTSIGINYVPTNNLLKLRAGDDTPTDFINSNQATVTERGIATNLSDAKFVIDAGFGHNGNIDGDVKYKGVITWTISSQYVDGGTAEGGAAEGEAAE